MREPVLHQIATVAILMLTWTQSVSADNASDQQNMDAFYSTDHVINLTVTMSSADWNRLRTEEPQGGNCNNDFIGSRYTWFEAQNLAIEIADLDGNVSAQYEYPDIGIKKKSYCGSIDSEKPSLNVDLSKYDDANDSKAESEIGTTRLTWNNSVQDPSVLKQCFGYQLFRLAGLPASRCNVAWLSIYTPDTNSTEEVGIYVNVEPIKKKYLKNPANAFTAGDAGNLYEIATHDIDLDGVTYNGYEGYSDEYVRQDYAWSAQQMDHSLLSGITASVDVDEYIRYWAMEAITQHRDGYSRNITNTYIYNDNDLVDAASLSEGNIAFSFLPWGIDKIMDRTDCWQIYCCAGWHRACSRIRPICRGSTRRSPTSSPTSPRSSSRSTNTSTHWQRRPTQPGPEPTFASATTEARSTTRRRTSTNGSPPRSPARWLQSTAEPIARASPTA